MITKEQFEAHVREQAVKKYADDRGWFIGDKAQECVGYIAARMDHEWPLVEALESIRFRLSTKPAHHIKDGDYCMTPFTWDQQVGNLIFAKADADDALAPYTTKPTEQP